MALEKELATYEAKLPELRQHEGKYVLIHGDDVVQLFTSYEDAIQHGYREFGIKSPFLVKQIHTLEKLHFISRLGVPAT